VSTCESIDAAGALAVVELADRRQVRAALRTTQVKDAHHDGVSTARSRHCSPAQWPSGQPAGSTVHWRRSGW